MTLLITALVVLLILALVVWLVDRSPFDATIRWCIIAVAVVVAIIVLVQRSGLS